MFANYICYVDVCLVSVNLDAVNNLVNGYNATISIPLSFVYTYLL